ncbi:MAG TPA: hypothetical protein VFR67_18090 [Pilimelia sp.]|nr:hypothetical protein [Pilimelia sp.]
MNLTRHDRTSPAAAARLDDRAAAALTCGVAGLFMFNIILGPLAIGLGAAAAKRGTRGQLSHTVALLGIALGVIDLLVLAVLVASRLQDGAFTWHLGL